jgi:hypothetical protein
VLILRLASALVATGEVDAGVTLLRETGEDATFPWEKPYLAPYALVTASWHLDAAGRLDEARVLARRSFALARERSVDDACDFLIAALVLEWRGQSDREIFSSALENLRDPWASQQPIAMQLGFQVMLKLRDSGLPAADRWTILEEVITRLEPVWNGLNERDRKAERPLWTEIFVNASIEHLREERYQDASAALARAWEVASPRDREQRGGLFRSLGAQINAGLARQRPAQNPR